MSKTLRHIDGLCVVIPTYNNAATVVDVVTRCQAILPHIIVVDDGSTDATGQLVAAIGNIHVVTHQKNKGKGCALLSGFRKAKELGYKAVITIDSDGQHYPEDLPLFIDAHCKAPDTIFIGARNLNQENISGKSKFANRFSNFWFKVQTGVSLADTQTGYRLYPLGSMHGLRLLTSRYESELELLVFAAWHDISISQIAINVYYPAPEERVTHFRPTYDFFRISVLNTILCLLAVIYGYPCKLICRLKR